MFSALTLIIVVWLFFLQDTYTLTVDQITVITLLAFIVWILDRRES